MEFTERKINNRSTTSTKFSKSYKDNKIQMNMACSCFFNSFLQKQEMVF